MAERRGLPDEKEEPTGGPSISETGTGGLMVWAA
jgi:hypothetical protein